MLYVGGGIISADAHQELLTFVERTNIRGHDAHGGGRISRESSALDEMVRHARLGLWQLGGDQSDLLLVLGARFATASRRCP